MSFCRPRRVRTWGAARAISAGDWDCEFSYSDRLYITGPEDLLRLLGKTRNKFDRVMLVGHETSMSATVGLLSGGTAVRFPTAAVARIDLAIGKWSQVEPGCGQLIWLVPPRLISRKVDD